MKALKIFIDTDFLVALNDADDSLHTKAVRLLKIFSQKTTSAFLSINILLEALTIISQRLGKKRAIGLLDELRSGKYLVVDLDEDLVLAGEEIFRKAKSKNISYSDCLSFAVMKRHKIRFVLSFDVHFKKQGFKRFGIDNS